VFEGEVMEEDLDSLMLQVETTFVSSGSGEAAVFKDEDAVGKEPGASMPGIHETIVLAGSGKAVAFEGKAMGGDLSRLMLRVDRHIVSADLDKAVVLEGNPIDEEDSRQGGNLDVA
jgi:hypothetical protein